MKIKGVASPSNNHTIHEHLIFQLCHLKFEDIVVKNSLDQTLKLSVTKMLS